MKFIICTVLTGNKYSVKDVNKLHLSLKQNTKTKFDFICYSDHTTGFDKNITVVPFSIKNKKLQWYKIDFFRKSFFYNNKIIRKGDEVNVIVMDIDLDIIGNVDFIFTPFDSNTFVGTHRWWWRWREDINNEFALSGTIYKFKMGNFEYVADSFESNISYWEEYFILNGITKGPVNGEQHFVQKMLMDNKANVISFPEKHIIKWDSNNFSQQLKIEKAYKEWSNNNYIDSNDKFHSDIRIVHYAGS